MDKGQDSKPVVKSVDMSEDMQEEVFFFAAEALEKNNVERDVATYIKRHFDQKYGPHWHCIVGRSFGSSVTHETKCFIYFYIGLTAILLYRTC
ncbi:dynein light chain 1 [Neoconidiobolus thromboides FSU 785]|nr:dynein light chain 1 [Neoconidiobolus thromboides FSU 785]